jgi:heparan-alpha-glucosaminide N-acetyltransferase
MIANPTATVKQTDRYLSLDVFRGVVMVFLMTEATLELPQLASYHQDSGFWQFIGYQTSHELWIGCRAWDLIQPSFMFMVGVAIPFSIVSRLAKGAAKADLWRHTWRRTAILILLGIFLRSMGREQTYFTFEDVITQIGLGYPILFWLALQSERVQWVSLAVILVGYWALFAFWPVSNTQLLQQYSLLEGSTYQPLTGFFAHWNIHANPANYFDQWFLNLFPREKPFIINRGGYQTLSFVPSLGTMLLGLRAGQLLQSDQSLQFKIRTLLIWGTVCIVLGLGFHYAGICPIVKRIWTPTWTLFSGGLVLLLLTLFVWLVELWRWRRNTFWFVVVGANSMAAYLTHWTIHSWMVSNARTHIGPWMGGLSEGVQHGIIGLIAFGLAWYLMVWLYNRKIFIRI